LLEAVTKELVATNKACGIKKTLTTRDYETLGMLNSAMKNQLTKE